MPRKLTTFAEKVASEKQIMYCPKCGGAMEPLFYIDCEQTPKGFWKFRERHVKVCKCNHDQYYNK